MRKNIHTSLFRHNHGPETQIQLIDIKLLTKKIQQIGYEREKMKNKSLETLNLSLMPTF